MKIQVTFIDAGNCEIAQYEINATFVSVALEVASSEYNAERHNFDDIRKVTLEIME